MIYQNISKDQIVKTVSTILFTIDPIDLRVHGVKDDEYLPEAKALVDILDKRVNFIHFWKDIHDVLLDYFEKKVGKQLCKKISYEIAVALSSCSFIEELRKNPSLKNLEDDFRLVIHDAFVIKYDWPERMLINDEVYDHCEEQDCEELLTQFVNDNSVYYVFYFNPSAFLGKKYIKVINKNRANIEELSKDKKVQMIVDNKALIYKADNVNLKE